jgi:alpha-L-fucosidase 2
MQNSDAGSRPFFNHCRSVSFVVALTAAGITAQPSTPIRWSTIGASITAGSGYPNKLQGLLGPAYKIENEGVSSCTMLKQGDVPYWTKGRLKETFAYKPDIVSVDLGGNDAKPLNWDAHKNEFIPDFEKMIDTLGTLSTRPRVIPCTPQPSWLRNGQYSFGISDVTIRNEIIPKIKQISQDTKLPYADTYTPLIGPDITTDGVHPDPAKPGADSIAAAIFRAYRDNVTRIACIGNSITDNSHNADAYPVKFNMLMGREYFVLNAGHSGKTLLRKGDAPYIQSDWFKQVFKFKPGIITIKLGTNDSKPQNWGGHKAEFAPDLRWFIDTLLTISPKPRIILCTPIPAWKDGSGNDPYGISGDVIKNEIIPIIKQVAQEKGLALLDLHTPYLPYQKLTPDGVHPNAAGLDTLAHILYRAFKAIPTSLAGDAARRTSGVTGAAPFSPVPSNPLAPFGIDAAGRALAPKANGPSQARTAPDRAANPPSP